MQNQMSAPAPSQGQPAPESGGASQLLADGFSNLAKLSDLLSGSSAATDTDKAKLAQILSEIQSFADSMGQPAGQDAQKPMPKGQFDMNAAAGAKPGAY